MTKSLGKAVGITKVETTINVFIHEDNAGDLTFANTFPPQFIPQSKYCGTKTIWFREEILKLGIKLCKIDTVYKLGDIFTNVLTRVAFE